MKRQILSVLLVLCLCNSSQPAVYAYKGVTSEPGEIYMKASVDEPDSRGDALDNDTEGPADESDSRGDALDNDTEDPADEPDSREDASDNDAETPAEEDTSGEEILDPGDVDTEDSTGEPSDSDDVTTDPSEDPADSKDADAEAPVEEGDTSGEEATDLPEALLLSENGLIKKSAAVPVTRDATTLTRSEIYVAMIALKDQDEYKEGATWTNYVPYPNTYGDDYHWNGGPLGGTNISAAGCVAFAFVLSDAAFGSLPARMYGPGEFSYGDIKVGDILQVNGDSHTVIVLEVSDAGVVIAEGNASGKVHWGRTIPKETVMRETSHYITRYPEDYVSPDEPGANESIGSGTLDGLSWNLTKAGTLTISGSGAMPDYSGAGEQPWNANSSKIKNIVIENGVSSIGSYAFGGCGVLNAEIPSSVKTIGDNAFRESSIISVTVPSSVKTIGDYAFYACQGLGSVTLCEGLETIGQNAFQACTSLTSITLPATVGKVGTAAFWQCGEMTDAVFKPGSGQVILGDSIFTQCYKLRNVTLPVNADQIGSAMFQNCGMLTKVKIPQGVESIGEFAFASSGLSDITIPDSVGTIGTAAFSACPLSNIYFTGTETQWSGITKMGDTATAVSKAAIHYEYDPDDGNTPGGGDDNSGGGNDNNGSNEGNNNNDSNGNNNNDSNEDNGNDSSNEANNGSDDSNGDKDDSNGENNDKDDSNEENNDNSPDTATAVKTDTAPAPVEVIPVEGVHFKEGYTTAQADVSRDQKLGTDLLRTYAGQNMYLNAVFGADFGLTIDMAGVPAVSKDLEIRYTLAEEPVLTPEFHVVHAIPNVITPLGFDAVFNFYVGSGHIGKKAYMYVLNAAGTGYDLIGIVSVNEIGNIAFHSASVTDAMIFIEK